MQFSRVSDRIKEALVAFGARWYVNCDCAKSSFELRNACTPLVVDYTGEISNSRHRYPDSQIAEHLMSFLDGEPESGFVRQANVFHASRSTALAEETFDWKGKKFSFPSFEVSKLSLHLIIATMDRFDFDASEN